MNEAEYKDALDRIAERGSHRGADAVFDAAATAPPTARSSSGPERLTRHWVLAVAAVVLLVAVGVGALKRSSHDDPQQILMGPGSDVHRYRVGDTGDIRVINKEARPDPVAQQQAFIATVTARLKAYGINDPSVVPDSPSSVIVDLPASTSMRVATVLLGTQGRLAMDQLDKTVETSDCTPGMSEGPSTTNLANSREGHWPTWGTVTNCYSVAQSNPISLWLQGRDPTARVPAPGASVEQRPRGDTVDVIVHFDAALNRVMGTISPATTPCEQPCAAPAVNGLSVTFDGTTLTAPDNLTHSSATFSVLSAEDANLLQAILLGGGYLSGVTIADLGIGPPPRTANGNPGPSATSTALPPQVTVPWTAPAAQTNPGCPTELRAWDSTPYASIAAKLPPPVAEKYQQVVQQVANCTFFEFQPHSTPPPQNGTTGDITKPNVDLDRFALRALTSAPTVATDGMYVWGTPNSGLCWVSIFISADGSHAGADWAVGAYCGTTSTTVR